jgi:hypothetical protein
MKSNKKKKQPLGTFIYPPSNLTTYLPNQIQTCVYVFGQGKNFQPWLAYYVTQMVEDSKFHSVKFSNLPIEVILVGNSDKITSTDHPDINKSTYTRYVLTAFEDLKLPNQIICKKMWGVKKKEWRDNCNS